MKDNFDVCADFTFQFEGGFVNNPHDPGGATNFGITRNVLAAWRKRATTAYDVRVMTKAEAKEIYKVLYWDHILADGLPAGVDLICYDIAVNMGTSRQHDFYRQVVGKPADQQIKELDKLRCGFWRHLRTFSVFGKGWLRRETACLTLALKMCGEGK